MLGLLFLGFLFGISHAFEADHVAAVSSLVSGRTEIAAMVRHGAIWGVGHTLTLALVGGGILLTGHVIGPRLENSLELVVGVMLLGLGSHVLVRLYRSRIHFHTHRHLGGAPHLHLHSHQGETAPHDAARHIHTHPDHAAIRTLVVGMMHGLAGSASLVLVAAAAMTSAYMGMLYVLLFGLGSVLGMALMSAALALPLRYTALALTRVNRTLQFTIGCLTLAVGLAKVVSTSQILLG